MALRTLTRWTAAALVASSSVLFAADGEHPAKADKGGKPDKTEKKEWGPAAEGVKGGPRLTQPWSKLASLTPEQRAKIHDIHEGFLKQEKVMREKEEAEIKATLTDEQKKELAEAETKDKVEKKTKAAEQREGLKELKKEHDKAGKGKEGPKDGGKAAGGEKPADRTGTNPK